MEYDSHENEYTEEFLKELFSDGDWITPDSSGFLYGKLIESRNKVKDFFNKYNLPFPEKELEQEGFVLCEELEVMQLCNMVCDLADMILYERELKNDLVEYIQGDLKDQINELEKYKTLK